MLFVRNVLGIDEFLDRTVITSRPKSTVSSYGTARHIISEEADTFFGSGDVALMEVLISGRAAIAYTSFQYPIGIGRFEGKRTFPVEAHIGHFLQLRGRRQSGGP